MHDHGTAVLARKATAATPAPANRTARERWLAQCEAALAEALATGNPTLLPRLPQLVHCQESDLCEDCRGTGYAHDGATFDLCYCMGDVIPYYDFPRYAPGAILAAVVPRDDGLADVWKPCPHCGLEPIQGRAHSNATRVPWVPDCPACHDTGWAFQRTVPCSALW